MASRQVAAPAVSVIMPCRNGMPFLPEAVHSVLEQDVPLELLLVDVASTDGSRDWVEKLGDPRIRLVPAREGTPPGAARNLAIVEARADLLAFLDADDVWEPGKLSRSLSLLEGSDSDLVFTDCTVIDRRGRPLGSYQARHGPVSGDVLEALMVENFVPLSTVVVRRTAVSAAGGFPEGFGLGSDYLLLLRLARVHRFSYSPERTSAYRVHAGNLTRDYRTAYQENLRLFEVLESDGSWSSAETRGLRNARALIAWRWAIAEAAAGPAAWSAAARRAWAALRISGVRTPFVLFGVSIGVMRGLPVRLRMRSVRKEAPWDER